MIPDYTKGKIYKLVNDSLNLTYYGSTIQLLHKRLYQHKTALRKCSSEILFTEGKCKIYLVEEFPCDNKNQLEQQERYYIENNDCINKNIPCRTKDEIQEQVKQYREENKEDIKQYQQQYNKKRYEDNKGAIKEQQKEYYEENKDKIKEQQKQYREENKDKIKEYRSEKLTCECASIVSRKHMARHKKTKKHINYSL